MLKLNNISLSIAHKTVLNNISIHFHEGEIIGIIGKPASGKTILLQTIAQIQRDYMGDMLLYEKPITQYKKNELAKILSFEPNTTFNNYYITLYDYLLSSRIPHKHFLAPFSSFDHEIVNEYIAIFQLEEYTKTPLLMLSSDIQTRARLAFHFIRQSQIVLLDNPTQNLSISSCALVHDTIIKYCSSGKNCCIISSNDINFLTQTVDKLYIVDNGNVALSCYPNDLTEEIIKKYWGVDVFITRNIYNGKPNIHLYFQY